MPFGYFTCSPLSASLASRMRTAVIQFDDCENQPINSMKIYPQCYNKTIGLIPLPLFPASPAQILCSPDRGNYGQ